MRKHVFAAVAFTAFVVMSSSSVVAQSATAAAEEGGCGTIKLCTYMGEAGHSNQGPGGNAKNMHGPCYQCVYGDCHPSCETASLDAETRSVYAAVLTAAQDGDAHAVLSAVPNADGYVVVNVERMAVQIMSCTKDSILASLPLQASDHVLALALARRAGQIATTF